MSQHYNFIKDEAKLLRTPFIFRGIEKEALRVDNKGYISQKTHPRAFGSKLKHAHITTDYSENLLEFITGVSSDISSTLESLQKIHQFCYLKNPEEFIWPASMPAILPADEASIPLADYGSSNIGKLKTLYRKGLGFRYGRSMQTIAGIHYNFSLSSEFWNQFYQYSKATGDVQSFINEKYFHLIRNYRRYSWILVYLYGATPVVDESFLINKEHKLQKINSKTFGFKFATSLRMGGLGYTSDAQKNITICYNQLKTYIATLEQARTTSYPAYEKIGLKDSQGEYKQLNTNLLQIDNEFYSTIRPKRTASSGQSALQALDEGGIEYLEIRLLDINPFFSMGISESQIKFIDNFLLFCLLEDSPYISDEECAEIDENFLRVVTSGRDPELTLRYKQSEIPLCDYGVILMDKIHHLANLIDEAKGEFYYTNSVVVEKQKLKNAGLTPSAQIMKRVQSQNYIDFILEQAGKIRLELEALPLLQNEMMDFEKLAQNSLEEQAEVEEADDLSFDEFLVKYFQDIRLRNLV